METLASPPSGAPDLAVRFRRALPAIVGWIVTRSLGLVALGVALAGALLVILGTSVPEDTTIGPAIRRFGWVAGWMQIGAGALSFAALRLPAPLPAAGQRGMGTAQSLPTPLLVGTMVFVPAWVVAAARPLADYLRIALVVMAGESGFGDLRNAALSEFGGLALFALAATSAPLLLAPFYQLGTVLLLLLGPILALLRVRNLVALRPAYVVWAVLVTGLALAGREAVQFAARLGEVLLAELPPFDGATHALQDLLALQSEALQRLGPRLLAAAAILCAGLPFVSRPSRSRA